MIIDFHTHAKLSKNIPFLPERFRSAMREAGGCPNDQSGLSVS
mgnify:CR=1 FL=1